MASLYNYLATKLQVASYYNQNPSDVETVGTIKTTLPPKRGIASFQKNNRVFTSTGFSAVLFIQNATQVNSINAFRFEINKFSIKAYAFKSVMRFRQNITQYNQRLV